MAEEIKVNRVTGETLYACRFLGDDSNVMLSDPATNEVWGTGGRDADDYDIALTEEDGSGHYTADFAAGGAIDAGVYHVAVYKQTGANPADSPTDVAVFQGQIAWDGSAEITIYTIYINTKGQVHTTDDDTPFGPIASSSGIAEGC